MPDTGASRKRQISGCLIRFVQRVADFWWRLLTEFLKLARRMCYVRVTNAPRMRQRKSWEFFPRRFAPPFSEFGRTGSRIRETLMSANADHGCTRSD
jgi:hypothetical protein